MGGGGLIEFGGWATLVGLGLTLTDVAGVGIGVGSSFIFPRSSSKEGNQLRPFQACNSPAIHALSQGLSALPTSRHCNWFPFSVVPKESNQPILSQPGIALQTTILCESSQIRHP